MLLQEKTKQMKVTKALSLVLILLALSMKSCLPLEEQVICLNELLRERKNNNLEKAITDSINSWADKELKHMTYFKKGMYAWKLDGLIENSDSDRLFGWILQVDNDDDKKSLDYVHYFSGEKREDRWFFYLHNMPSIWADRENNRNQKYTFEQLSEIARKEVVNGGLVNNNCKIDDSYINGWIDREGRSLFELHTKFLQSSSK